MYFDTDLFNPHVMAKVNSQLHSNLLLELYKGHVGRRQPEAANHGIRIRKVGRSILKRLSCGANFEVVFPSLYTKADMRQNRNDHHNLSATHNN